MFFNKDIWGFLLRFLSGSELSFEEEAFVQGHRRAAAAALCSISAAARRVLCSTKDHCCVSPFCTNFQFLLLES